MAPKTVAKMKPKPNPRYARPPTPGWNPYVELKKAVYGLDNADSLEVRRRSYRQRL